jgi:hypothetical protein
MSEPAPHERLSHVAEAHQEDLLAGAQRLISVSHSCGMIADASVHAADCAAGEHGWQSPRPFAIMRADRVAPEQ